MPLRNVQNYRRQATLSTGEGPRKARRSLSHTRVAFVVKVDIAGISLVTARRRGETIEQVEEETAEEVQWEKLW